MYMPFGTTVSVAVGGDVGDGTAFGVFPVASAVVSVVFGWKERVMNSAPDNTSTSTSTAASMIIATRWIGDLFAFGWGGCAIWPDQLLATVGRSCSTDLFTDGVTA